MPGSEHQNGNKRVIIAKWARVQTGRWWPVTRDPTPTFRAIITFITLSWKTAHPKKTLAPVLLFCYFLVTSSSNFTVNIGCFKKFKYVVVVAVDSGLMITWMWVERRISSGSFQKLRHSVGVVDLPRPTDARVSILSLIGW